MPDLDDLGPFLRRLTADVSETARVARDLVLGRDPGNRGYTIALYRGFGANGRVDIRGRVLKEDPIPAAAQGNSRWQNFMGMVRRIESDALAYARVRVRAGANAIEVRADDEGYFHAELAASNTPRIDDEWIEVSAELIEAAPGMTSPVSVTGRALCPRRAPEFIVISDVDDTVLQSNVTNLLDAFRTMLLENARTRLPFPGVAAFYRALRAGGKGSATNPIVYISSSPWNLYDVIVEFLDAQGIPAGPVLLRDVDLGLDVLAAHQHHSHKRDMVRRVLTTYADVPVILVGDSGQQDPEIYRDVVREFPGRVLAVYIRNVSKNPERAIAIQTLADQVLADGSSLVLADDTLAVARHAAANGWITSAAVATIGEDKKADEGTKPGKADAPGARGPDDSAPTIVVE